MKFFEKWDKLENLKAKVLLKHILFGRQFHDCESLRVINDDKRIGIVLKGQDIFVHKDVCTHWEESGVLSVSDGMQTITLFVNNL